MIVSLITLYNPETTVIDNVSAISEQSDKVYICDNSPINNGKMFSNIEKTTYVFNGQNLALSGAFNRVLKNGEYNWSNEDYIFFFDQDSYIEPGHIKGLVCEYKKLEKAGYQVGCLGPIYFNRSINQLAIPRVKKQITETSYIVKSIITSSMLVKYETLKKIDFWNEKIFLDLADWDLCWRIREKGYLCIETRAVILNHAVGRGYKQVGFIKIAESSEIREYYQTRNYLYLMWKKYVPIKYKIGFLKNLIIRPILHYIYLDNGKIRLKYIREAIIDYKHKYYGDYDGRSVRTK